MISEDPYVSSHTAMISDGLHQTTSRDESDLLVKNLNTHIYTVSYCTDKGFVGININHDEDFKNYIDQTLMITEIVKGANLTEVKEPFTVE